MTSRRRLHPCNLFPPTAGFLSGAASADSPGKGAGGSANCGFPSLSSENTDPTWERRPVQPPTPEPEELLRLAAAGDMSEKEATKESVTFKPKLLADLVRGLADDPPVFFLQGRQIVQAGQTGLRMYAIVEGKVTVTIGGRVVERGRLGLVAAFGLEPVEDAPRRAVHAAIAVQKAADRARAEGEAVSVKLAIHVGRLLVGVAGNTFEIDLDAKLQAWTILDALVAHGAPDTIMVSEAAGPFLERRFELNAEGPLERAPGRAYRLVGHERPFGAGRRVAPFIGRRDSLQLLHNLLAATVRGQGQVVGIVGEAGLGKSRLIAEFRQSLGEG